MPLKFADQYRAHFTIVPTTELRTFYPNALWLVYPGHKAFLYANGKDGGTLLTVVEDGWQLQENISDVLATAELKFLGGVKE